MSEGRRTAPARAETRSSWWPGWIWSVPIAALAIGAWLLIRFLAQGGTDITIIFTDAQGVKPKDTSIEYRGMAVGSVTGVALGKDGRVVEVSATIQDSASKFLRKETIFWLRGVNPSLGNLSSLGAILSGPTIVMEPGPGEETKVFKGLGRKPAVPRGQGAPVVFAVSFRGNVGELSAGDAVKLRGFTVGEVDQIGFHYDVNTDEIETPVTLALYPSLFHIRGGAPAEGAGGFEAALGQLVSQGLRANLEREPPLIGGYRVALEMVPGAPAARLDTAASPPEIPAAPGGSGLESIVNRFNNVPIEQIAQNVLDMTQHVDQIASSPELKESIAELNASLREVHRTVDDLGPKVDRLVGTLQNTSQQLEETARAADRTLGGPTTQTGVRNTLREIKEAARAVRALADYLNRHPEALLSGRPEE